MTLKSLLLLAALTLCCCITTLHGCKCIRTTVNRVPVQAIRKIEVLPISGQCRWTEIIVTKKNDHRICVNPSAKWVKNLLTDLQRRNEERDETTLPQTASTTAHNF